MPREQEPKSQKLIPPQRIERWVEKYNFRDSTGLHQGTVVWTVNLDARDDYPEAYKIFPAFPED